MTPPERVSGLTYAEVGATARGALPGGYRHLRHRTVIGSGRHVLREAADAVLEFWMHRGAGVRIEASARRAAPGVYVESRMGIGPLSLSAPCRVVWAEDGERRAGFGYGTLPGHPATGEESFVVELDDMDDVWLEVTSFSRPAGRLMRAAGPLAPMFQRVYAHRLGTTLRRLVR
ncbi:DUF1990 domain-containing protein [Actinomadura rubrobrunea]|uniref:DUF1990 domain-containing protein n=1 Tax=Actinomadura rubrobrunea TaxID=115335 RepID=A0A9W6PQQ2_9ACTN|nr:DUF1990 domain-containing protein [Actinomadura rubrobrunea]